MALPTYQLNSIPTVDEFNAFLRPAFDKDEAAEEFPGHLHRLRDDALSNDATQIKTRYGAFEQEFLVTVTTGLNVGYKGGRVELPTGVIVTIAPGAIALPDNSNPVYIYISETGSVSVATKKPQKLFLLATATTSGGAITSLIDANRSLRGNYVKPQWNAVSLFGGVGSEGDYTVTGAETWSNTYYSFKNLTIASTGAVTIPGGAIINISENCTISGSITVTSQVGGAPGQPFLIAPNVTIDCLPGRGISPGSSDSGGAAISFAASPQGSGGANGTAVSSSAAGNSGGTTGTGGKGGGFVIINCFGDLAIAASGSIAANGGDALTTSLTSGNCSAGGAGGGSGGLIRLQAYGSISVAGTLAVKGGKGGNAASIGTPPYPDIGGGGGGGGGFVILICPTINTTGSAIDLSAGAGGTILGTGGAIRAGGGGGFGGAGGGRSTAGSIGKLITRTILPSFAG